MCDIGNKILVCDIGNVRYSWESEGGKERDKWKKIERGGGEIEREKADEWMGAGDMIGEGR